jgi:hypothetical protein
VIIQCARTNIASRTITRQKTARMSFQPSSVITVETSTKMQVQERGYLRHFKGIPSNIFQYITFPSYTTSLHYHNTFTCYNFLATCFGRPFATIIRPILYSVCVPYIYIFIQNSAFNQCLHMHSIVTLCNKTFIQNCEQF